MTKSPLRIVANPLEDTQAAFDLDERRSQPRHASTECVTVVRRNFHALAYQHPICSMRLRDVSNTGASAICDIPLQAGEAISLFFTSSKCHTEFESHGTVLRCTPANADDTESQYFIAIEFNRAMSA